MYISQHETRNTKATMNERKRIFSRIKFKIMFVKIFMGISLRFIATGIHIHGMADYGMHSAVSITKTTARTALNRRCFDAPNIE